MIRQADAPQQGNGSRRDQQHRRNLAAHHRRQRLIVIQVHRIDPQRQPLQQHRGNRLCRAALYPQADLLPRQIGQSADTLRRKDMQFADAQPGDEAQGVDNARRQPGSGHVRQRHRRQRRRQPPPADRPGARRRREHRETPRRAGGHPPRPAEPRSRWRSSPNQAGRRTPAAAVRSRHPGHPAPLRYATGRPERVRQGPGGVTT